MGVLIGIAVAAPIGPIGLLCVRKTLDFGIAGTLAVGSGAAMADAVYAGIVVLSLAALAEYLVEHEVYFKICGGVLLFCLAVKEYWTKNNVEESIKITKSNWLSIASLTFILTLSNPIGIVSFIGLFAMLGDNLQAEKAPALIAGVFMGSMMWWLILGGAIHRTKNWLPEHFIVHIHKISAIILAAFGLAAFISLI